MLRRTAVLVIAKNLSGKVPSGADRSDVAGSWRERKECSKSFTILVYPGCISLKSRENMFLRLAKQMESEQPSWDYTITGKKGT
jgi:hypothetical protein